MNNQKKRRAQHEKIRASQRAMLMVLVVLVAVVAVVMV